MRNSRIAQEVKRIVSTRSRSRFLRIITRILVHDRRAEITGERCSCCGSPDAEIVETIPAGDLVIDLRTGKRIEPTHPDWRELCELADLRDLSLRCAVSTLRLLLDKTGRDIFASGGNRAGKTTLGLYWLALQWVQRGGRECRFWLVASSEEKCFRLLSKMFRGTGKSPPVMPAELIESCPSTHRASNLQTTLVDGSLIDLRGFKNDPGAERLKSDDIIAALVDEAAHLPSHNSLVALRGRCVDNAGRLWLASTPRPDSVLRGEVEKALEFERLPAEDERKISGAHEGAAWLFQKLPMMDNPWVPRANIEAKTRTLDMSRPESQRDFEGEWVANEGLFWIDIFRPDRHTYSHEERDLSLWSPTFLASVGAAGHVPVTKLVRRHICTPTRNPHHATIAATNDNWLIGQDCNYRMESVVVQVSAPADARDKPDLYHYWVQDCVTTPRSNSDAHAARLVSPEIGKLFDHRRAKALDGCLVVLDATSFTIADPHQQRHGLAGSIVDTFARHNLEARAPLYRKDTATGKYKKAQPERVATFKIIRRLLDENRLHVATRAGALLTAFATQLSEPNGECPLDGRRGVWDERMGPVDALRYLLYAAVNARVVQAAGYLGQAATA